MSDQTEKSPEAGQVASQTESVAEQAEREMEVKRIERLREIGGCSCHLSPPCRWCESLNEMEAEEYSSGGMEALGKHWEKELERLYGEPEVPPIARPACEGTIPPEAPGECFGMCDLPADVMTVEEPRKYYCNACAPSGVKLKPLSVTLKEQAPVCFKPSFPGLIGAKLTVKDLQEAGLHPNPPFSEDTPRYRLWKFFSDEHKLTLVESELDEIIREVGMVEKTRVHQLQMQLETERARRPEVVTVTPMEAAKTIHELEARLREQNEVIFKLKIHSAMRTSKEDQMEVEKLKQSLRTQSEGLAAVSASKLALENQRLTSELDRADELFEELKGKWEEREEYEELTRRELEQMVRCEIGVALGFASMCWNPKPTGCFDSEPAAKKVEELTDYVMSIVGRPKLPERRKKAVLTDNNAITVPQLSVNPGALFGPPEIQDPHGIAVDPPSADCAPMTYQPKFWQRLYNRLFPAECIELPKAGFEVKGGMDHEHYFTFSLRERIAILLTGRAMCRHKIATDSLPPKRYVERAAVWPMGWHWLERKCVNER